MSLSRVIAALLAAGVVACSAPAPIRAEAAQNWPDLATMDRQSPAKGTAASVSWQGADGKPVSVAVDGPVLGPGKAIVSLQPHTGDNGPAIVAALGKLRAAGGGTLHLSPGAYPIQTAPPGLVIENLSDVLIDAPGAHLVFAQWGDGILVRNAVRLAIKGLSVGFAQPPVVRATVRQGELTFAGGPPPPGAMVHQITTSDSPGKKAGETRLLLGKAGKSILVDGPNSFKVDGGLGSFADGSAVDVKFSYYLGAAIRIADQGDKPLSHDISFDDITIRNSAGGGIVVDLMGRGLAVLRSQIGVSGPAGLATIAYDAFHVTAMTGDVLLQSNHFAGSGDDAMNLSSPIFDMTPNSDGSATIGPKNAGAAADARYALFDANMQLLGVTQLASRAARDPKSNIKVAFAMEMPVSKVRYARNLALIGTRYAVIGNDVSNCHCHAVLAQGPNGLVRGNTVSGISANAVRLVTSAWWHEGAGAQNVVVDKNVIHDTGIDPRGGIVWGAITIYAEGGDDAGISQPAITAQHVHNRIVIRDNMISDVAQGCISVSSAADVTLAHNSCTRFNQQLDRPALLVERASIADGVRRLPAKNAYLMKGDGIWIDPLSTARVTGAPE